jgi:transposase
MTYRELSMIDVKELLRRWAAGHSDRKIARETGSDRKTVRRYLSVAAALSLPRDRELTDEEVHEVGRRVQARELGAPSQQWQDVAEHRERIVAWLDAKRPLRISKVYKLLVRDHGLQASYDTVRRYAMRELGWGKKAATVRLDDPPAGQEAQVDFGRMGPMWDAIAGRARTLWALIVTLSFSRYQFVWPTFVQSTAAVCEGLDHAWWFFGAMPKTIVPDNTLDYVQARDIFVDPARVRRPKDKARVENQVPFVRESWFDGETFADLHDARQSAERWCRDDAGSRVHGTTCQVPREVFEASEKATMLAPPSGPFDVPLWVEAAKVHPDHHIQVARALYSVPTIYLHKTVRARADQTTVKIYFGTELIKMHPRKPPGARSTDTNDYPIGKAPYALRSVDALLSKAREKGDHIGTYAERLLGGPLPWTRMRQVYALLRLCDKFSEGRVEGVCQSALSFDVIDVTRISRMLKLATKLTPKNGAGKVVQLPAPRFARPGEHFETRPGSTKKEGV